MEKFILRFLILATISLSLASCGGGMADTSSGIDSYVVTNGAFTTTTSDNITGLGGVRFVNVLNGIFSYNSIALKAQLDATGNSVTVFMNTSATVMTNSSAGGIAITFQRSGASVLANIAVNGSSVSVNASQLVFYVPSAIDVIIDVHNISASQSRVMIWRRDLTVYNSTNADVDTNTPSDYSGTYPNQGGQGQNAGLYLNNATVTGANIGIAKAP